MGVLEEYIKAFPAPQRRFAKAREVIIIGGITHDGKFLRSFPGVCGDSSWLHIFMRRDRAEASP